MIAEIKTFLFSWVSLGLFWGMIVYFCFAGTQSIKHLTWSRSIKHFIFGLPFFLLFIFMFKAFGVPQYIIYDHVKPVKTEHGYVIPAIKVHPLLQSLRFEKLGAITTDLNTFIDDERLFRAKRQTQYASIAGFKTYANESFLVVLFIIWLVFLNRLHNSLSSSDAFRDAIDKPSLANFNSYMIASDTFAWLQPLKRRKAKRSIKEIHKIYNKLLCNMLQVMQQHGGNRFLSTISLAIDTHPLNSTTAPTINAAVSLTDITSSAQREQWEKQVNFGRSHQLPDSEKLSQGLTDAVIGMLNSYLPEPYVEKSDKDADIQLDCPLTYHSCGHFTETKSQKTILALLFKANPQAPQLPSTFVPSIGFHNFTAQKLDNASKQKLSVARRTSQQLCSVLFSGKELSEIPNSNDDARKAEIKKQAEHSLDIIKNKNENLFDTIYKECKSAVRGEITDEVIAQVLIHNKTQVDAVLSEVYDSITTHGEFFFDVIASDVAFGLIENVVGGE